MVIPRWRRACVRGRSGRSCSGQNGGGSAGGAEGEGDGDGEAKAKATAKAPRVCPGLACLKCGFVPLLRVGAGTLDADTVQTLRESWF